MSDVHQDAATVTAEGGDPDLVVALVAASAGRGPGPGAIRRRLRDAAGTDDRPPGDRLRSLLDRPDAGARRLAADPLARWAALGVRVAVIGDAGYPAVLAEGWPHVAAPMLIAWRGVPPCDASPAVAIVGARAASGYGVSIAAWLAEAVARAGGRVVSGGAVGVDAAAHRAALEEPGGTTVVLGCGHAVAYPREHARPGGLFDDVLAHGGTLLSELLPTTPPRPEVVRTRNRILAGLSDVVVVVEGGARSGALLTATAAAELDRAVLAVPGDVRAPGSEAPHRLLAEGAAPCTDPADVFAALAARRGTARAVGPDGPGPAPAARAPGRPSVLPDGIRAALVAAWPRPLRLEALAERAGTPVPALLGALARARAGGELEEGPDGLRLRHPPDGR